MFREEGTLLRLKEIPTFRPDFLENKINKFLQSRVSMKFRYIGWIKGRRFQNFSAEYQRLVISKATCGQTHNFLSPFGWRFQARTTTLAANSFFFNLPIKKLHVNKHGVGSHFFEGCKNGIETEIKSEVDVIWMKL